MKTRYSMALSLGLAALTLAAAFYASGCSKSTDDPCADTIAPQVSVQITYIVRTWYQVHGEAPGELPGCRVDITVRKLLCEGGSKGVFDYPDSYTASPNVYQFTVGYNLQNTKDRIHLSAHSVPGEPPWPDNLSSIAHTDVNDYISYSEASAAGSSMTRYVDIVQVAGRTTASEKSPTTDSQN